MKNINIFLKYLEFFLVLAFVVNILTIQFLTAGGIKAFSTDEYLSYERIVLLSVFEALLYAIIYCLAEIHENKNKKKEKSR
jgi:hypothetical protein